MPRIDDKFLEIQKELKHLGIFEEVYEDLSEIQDSPLHSRINLTEEPMDTDEKQ